MTRALPPWIRIGDGFITAEIVARPGSPRRGLIRVEERGLVIGIRAPAEKGKANQELIETVAEMAVSPRSAVSILRGTSSRTKVVRIATPDAKALAERLSSLSLKS